MSTGVIDTWLRAELEPRPKMRATTRSAVRPRPAPTAAVAARAGDTTVSNPSCSALAVESAVTGRSARVTILTHVPVNTKPTLNVRIGIKSDTNFVCL